jgi:hypothetical protein
MSLLIGGLNIIVDEENLLSDRCAQHAVSTGGSERETKLCHAHKTLARGRSCDAS